MQVNPNIFGNDLLNALGLQDKHVTRITLDVQACKDPQVRVAMNVRSEDGESFKSVISRYTLVPKVQT